MGRPNVKWIDAVAEDVLTLLGTHNWRDAVEDRVTHGDQTITDTRQIAYQ